MELLFYNELQPLKNREQFDRVCDMLRRGDFAQAEVKKLTPGRYYRAKLNDSDKSSSSTKPMKSPVAIRNPWFLAWDNPRSSCESP